MVIPANLVLCEACSNRPITRRISDGVSSVVVCAPPVVDGDWPTGVEVPLVPLVGPPALALPVPLISLGRKTTRVARIATVTPSPIATSTAPVEIRCRPSDGIVPGGGGAAPNPGAVAPNCGGALPDAAGVPYGGSVVPDAGGVPYGGGVVPKGGGVELYAG